MFCSWLKRALVCTLFLAFTCAFVGCAQPAGPDKPAAGVAQQPAAKQPAEAQPAKPQPVAQAPAAQRASAERKPRAEKPKAETSVAEKPVAQPPAAQKAAAAAPVAPKAEAKQPDPPKSLAIGDNEEGWQRFQKEAIVQYGFNEVQTKSADEAVQSCLKRAASRREQHKEAVRLADQGKDAAARAKADSELQTALDKLADECVSRIDMLASVEQVGKAAKAGFESPKKKNPPAKPEVGFKAPPWELKNAEDKKVSLESLKGKVVVLHFWATWCGFCKKSMPEMEKFRESIKDKSDIVLYGVNCRQRPGNPEPAAFAKEQGCNYNVLLNGDEVSTAYEVQGFPTLYVIGPDGKIIYKERGLKPDLAPRVESLIQKAIEDYAKQAKG
jgi:cytochrome c biogenesis protein CcmG, thiol:disulfide interchange protein DsbE